MVTTPSILVLGVFQLAVEALAHQHGWAIAIREAERADEGRDAWQDTKR